MGHFLPMTSHLFMYSPVRPIQVCLSPLYHTLSPNNTVLFPNQTLFSKPNRFFSTTPCLPWTPVVFRSKINIHPHSRWFICFPKFRFSDHRNTPQCKTGPCPNNKKDNFRENPYPKNYFLTFFFASFNASSNLLKTNWFG